MSLLHIIADNPELKRELQTLFRDLFSIDDLRSDQLTDDKILGQITRARLEGLRKVDEGFRQIAQHQTTKEITQDKNPAR